MIPLPEDVVAPLISGINGDREKALPAFTEVFGPYFDRFLAEGLKRYECGYGPFRIVLESAGEVRRLRFRKALKSADPSWKLFTWFVGCDFAVVIPGKGVIKAKTCGPVSFD